MSRAKSLILSSPYKLQIIFLCIGLFLVVIGLVVRTKNSSSPNIEVLESTPLKSTLVVDVSGAVVNPGVYTLNFGSRVDDAILKAGGLMPDADKTWIDKNLNRAAKLIDGQKLFIPIKQSVVLSASDTTINTNVAQSNNTSDSNLVNINTASLNELEGLSGIGPVYGQNIIDNRPYSDINDLVNKKVLKSSTFEKIKDKISVN